MRNQTRPVIESLAERCQEARIPSGESLPPDELLLDERPVKITGYSPPGDLARDRTLRCLVVGALQDPVFEVEPDVEYNFVISLNRQTSPWVWEALRLEGRHLRRTGKKSEYTLVG